MFNIAYKGIVGQGGPSVNAFGSCEYRGPNGLKCAIGHLIKDKEYDESWEGYNLYSSAINLDMETSSKKFKFIAKMQSIHDDIGREYKSDLQEFMEKFKIEMAKLAAEYELTVPAV